jgi:peptide/nickel transport system permease protein
VSVTPEVVLDEPIGVPRSPNELARRFRRLRRADQAAVVALVLLLLVSFLGPLLVAHDPVQPVGEPTTPPGGQFLFGTDELGHDIFSRVLHGARQSWIGAFAVIASGVLIGTAVGLIAGATGGRVDTVLMRITDAFLALPAPVLALAIAAALGRSYTNTLIAVSVVWWPLYARIVRAEIRAFTSRPFIEAATLAGVPAHRRWLRHLLPGAVPVILVAASLDVGGLILTVAGLSFLGLGAPQPAPELGAMTAQGIPYILSAEWVALFPALAVFLIALVSNLAGDALRDLLEE